MVLGISPRPIPPWYHPIRRGEIERSRRNLPHWNQEGATYFVTFRMADSISRKARDYLEAYRQEWLREHPYPWTNETERAYRKKFNARKEELMDAGYGSCIFKDPSIRKVVSDTLLHFRYTQFHMDSYAIMPNHVHALVCPIPPHSLSRIVHSWKSYTAQILCPKEGVPKPLWMGERWDHIVRDEYSFLKYREYIRQNPKKANLPTASYTLWPE